MLIWVFSTPLKMQLANLQGIEAVSILTSDFKYTTYHTGDNVGSYTPYKRKSRHMACQFTGYIFWCPGCWNWTKQLSTWIPNDRWEWDCQIYYNLLQFILAGIRVEPFIYMSRSAYSTSIQQTWPC
jgi:hypothetical protein